MDPLALVILVLTNILLVKGDGFSFPNLHGHGQPPMSQKNDTYKTTPLFITSYGYPLETHIVTTEDGYILTYYRIPHGRRKPIFPFSKSNKKVVLLQHGLLATSACWFIEERASMLPFMLADDGYDVWIGNSRGSSYSRAHVNASINSEEATNMYWAFSWEEMGRYDVPAGIDHILRTTKKKRLTYIGHSQGTTVLFAMLSLRPEYNLKLNLGIAYSPIAFMTRVRGPIQFLEPIAKSATYTSVGGVLTSILGVGKFLPDPFVDFLHQTDPGLCSIPALGHGVCDNILFILAGFDPIQLDYDRLGVSLAQFPDTSSVKSLLHYGQLIELESHEFIFKRFDYGSILNMNIYGTPTPPDFNLSLITAPIALYYGENDWLAPVEDVHHLRSLLPNVVEFKKIQWKYWNHFDYISSINATEFLYEPTIRLMKRFN